MSTAPRSPHRVTTYVLGGMVVLGLIGCVTGLILGLIAYPPTAWAAIVEVGLPAAVAGALIGLVVGLVAKAVRASHRRGERVADDV